MRARGGRTSLWKGQVRTAAVAGALALSVAATTAPADASPAAVPHQPQVPGAVSPTPVAGTPELLNRTGNTKDRIRQMVQCGSTMYAVGSFSQIIQAGVTYARNNVFSFSATAPYTITSWSPDVNGIINSIAFNGTNCSDAYIGGDFTSVDGTAVTDIAEISTSTGEVVSGFGTSTSGGQVETLLGVQGHILVGGYFTWINGSHADPYLASVSPVTGKDDGFLHLNISGYYHYCSDSGSCTSGKTSSVYNQELSHGGTLDLVEGDFTSVGGQPRQQIFMLNLATTPASVTAWTSPEWDGSAGNLPGGYPYQCAPIEAFYIRSAAWSPDDSTVCTGLLELRSNNTPVYSMSRANADNMLVTNAGLWISSSNRYGSQYCGQKPDHSGICLLPYPAA